VTRISESNVLEKKINEICKEERSGRMKIGSLSKCTGFVE
jgi:hypothetical protein